MESIIVFFPTVKTIDPTCWAVASEDKNEVLVTYVQVLAQVNMPSRKVRLRGFDPAKNTVWKEPTRFTAARC